MRCARDHLHVCPPPFRGHFTHATSRMQRSRHTCPFCMSDLHRSEATSHMPRHACRGHVTHAPSRAQRPADVTHTRSKCHHDSSQVEASQVKPRHLSSGQVKSSQAPYCPVAGPPPAKQKGQHARCESLYSPSWQVSRYSDACCASTPGRVTSSVEL